MEPKENIEVRQEMARMHDDVLKRIDVAYKNKQYIEVCWLCYACFESRVNRSLSKICSGCSKPKRADNKVVGITTKLDCYVRLIKSKYPPLCGENLDLVRNIKRWCKERNDLIHGLISLEIYNDADRKFRDLARRGVVLVNEMYDLSGEVRMYYYEAEEIPSFDESVTTKCGLKSKCIKE